MCVALQRLLISVFLGLVYAGGFPGFWVSLMLHLCLRGYHSELLRPVCGETVSLFERVQLAVGHLVGRISKRLNGEVFPLGFVGSLGSILGFLVNSILYEGAGAGRSPFLPPLGTEI